MVSNLHFQPRGCEFESTQEQGGKFLEGRMPKVYLETASLPQGVEKVAIEGEEKNELMVIGEEIDAAELVTTLRKKVGFANIVSSWRKDAEGLFGNSLSTPRGRESSYRR
ncbi:uncharacterized protein LOC107813655 isoform X3 [Nicotiana tabacum]|uniref:Uncharacterized protein LOC107813655 isoform X3 n=1 Tax=Nicotiana tabacum TaxID=4097 RepID=A0AC58RLI0_TOBAC